MDSNKIKLVVKQAYADIAQAKPCCGCKCKSQISKEIGYTDEEINLVPEANLGLGCGNPVAIGSIQPGDTILDLGSGAGLDAFLAAEKTGENGKVIGVDMTEEMIERAKKNAEQYNIKNVEFRLGDIENLPVEENTIDIIISNCVINLAPDKSKVFKEAFRVLKSGGKMFLSDIVLLQELSEEQRNDKKLLSGCVAGAMLKDDYIATLEKAGFELKIIGENKEISKQQYQDIPLESLAIEARKLV